VPPIPKLCRKCLNRDRRSYGLLAVVLLVALSMLLAACGGDDDDDGAAAGSSKSSEAAVKPPAGLVKSGTITFGADPSYPPLNSIEGGEHVGFEPEFAQLIADQLGLELGWVDVAFESLVPSLEAKKFDAVLSDLYITEERAKIVDFVPYNMEGVALVTKKDSDYAPTKDTDLCGTTVAAVSGSFQIPFFEEDGQTGKKCPPDEPIKVNTFRTEPLVMQEVSSGRADVATATVASGTKIVEEHPELGLKITDREDTLYVSAVGIAVNEHADALKAALEEVIAKLNENGQLPALLEKYGLPAADPAVVEKTLNGQD
jgi:polar amino acid transport system substrate-binding protein